jgi:2-polyprenyl-6-hydroxyphenyl methylase/3-demethylubiquinone-9 3-methyltransferase
VRCYDIAPARVQQYLAEEIEFVLLRVRPTDSVLELGCGYGRVLQSLIGHAREIVGIDTSRDSLALAYELLGRDACRLHEMDATALEFDDGRFDVVLCIQNGISAFGVDRRKLVREAVRVTRSGGRCIFSTYSPQFWPHRREWFELQAAEGLVGEIDTDATGDGVIVCKDGFRAGTVSAVEFRSLCDGLDITPNVVEVDESSVFFELVVP